MVPGKFGYNPYTDVLRKKIQLPAPQRGMIKILAQKNVIDEPEPKAPSYTHCPNKPKNKSIESQAHQGHLSPDLNRGLYDIGCLPALQKTFHEPPQKQERN